MGEEGLYMCHQDFVVDLSGSPEKTLAELKPTLNCVCGLAQRIQVVVSGCLLKIHKLREERNTLKQLFKQERVKVNALKSSIDDWEKNYYQMRTVAIKKWDSIPIDEEGLLSKNMELKNTIKQLTLKLNKMNKEKQAQRIVTESENLDIYLHDLKYSFTGLGKEEESSYLLECEREVLSSRKIDYNLITKESFG